MRMMSEFKCYNDHIQGPRKKLKSHPKLNADNFVCTCQDNNAHEENMRIAQTERKKL